MPISVSIVGVAPHFPEFRVGIVVAENLLIADERPAALDAIIAQREEAARARWRGTELSAIPGIAAWRSAYKAFGVKQTRYRSAVERLVKNNLAERPLPRVNAFVDLYNAVSITHVMPLGADDLDKIAPPLVFRFTRDGDSFVDMSGGEGGEGDVAEAPHPGEVVYADAAKVLCRRWNWRQDARSLIAPATRRAVVTVQANGAGDVEAAVVDLRDLIARFVGGETRAAILDTARPRADL
ncbi:MAG: hypothetical protein J0H62_01420 [Rhizobiales bacterium]|nr:hypothetical protein [Hyphomicrobiales bacterium]